MSNTLAVIALVDMVVIVMIHQQVMTHQQAMSPQHHQKSLFLIVQLGIIVTSQKNLMESSANENQQKENVQHPVPVLGLGRGLERLLLQNNQNGQKLNLNSN